MLGLLHTICILQIGRNRWLGANTAPRNDERFIDDDVSRGIHGVKAKGETRGRASSFFSCCLKGIPSISRNVDEKDFLAIQAFNKSTVAQSTPTIMICCP
jgi:hypothetical protein